MAAEQHLVIRPNWLLIWFQVALAEQFASHVAHDVKLLIAHASSPQLQSQNHGDPLRRGCVSLYGAGPHRRRGHHLHIVTRDANKVSKCINLTVTMPDH